ncbi:MAG: galactokinase [Gloeobacteraceae cyanobacterium ES-bin-316]|nr:galactokinase [Ferruginibacter sp.]
MLVSIDKKYKELFNQVPILVRSPGRINIIGEHTDYNEGFVLPAAIDKAIYVAVGKRTDEEIHLYAVDFKESYSVSITDLQPTRTWATYILGVADQLIKRGHNISGFNLVIDGDVPLGAGLSSSAAVECATVFALNDLFALGIDKMEMVKIAQKAEHVYAGVMCGIMDQFASMFGKKDHVIKLDCRSLEYEYMPIKLDGYKLVLFNSNVKHSLASTEYNTRRQQCEQGVAWVKEKQPQVNSLRDVNMEMLQEYVLPKDKLVFTRCKFVVEEIQRLLSACEDLQKGDIVALGKKLFSTHEGLSKEYEVSCKELDYLVNAVKENPAVLGARVMGGGFGGCTINIIREDAVDAIVAQLGAAYKTAMGLELSAYVVQTDDGTAIVYL